MAKLQQSVSLYTWGCSLFAAVGSLLYGIDSGIISTTISQPAFLEHFAPFTPSIKGAVVSIFSAGALFGVLFAGWAADYWGRKRTIQFAALFALIAGVIQAVSVNVGMLIAGRIIGGFAVGIMNMTIPIYNSEIAPPAKRGMIAGLHAQFVGIGFAVANWIGFGCSYSTNSFQWRFPLAVQCLPALIVLIGTFWLPYSPRWLLEKERDEEAYAVLKRLHGNIGADESFFRAEFAQMRDQIRFENSIKSTFTDLFTKPSNRRRLILAVLVQVFTQLSGINVINYYQTDLYKGLGITGHRVTLLASIYGMVGPLANVVCLWFVDSWGRKKTLWITGIIMAVDISLVMAMTASFSKTSNEVGKGFAIAFIFCFSIIYSLGYNSIHYIYVPEIMTMAIRARGSSIAVCSNVLVNIIFNQVSPIAFAHVGWKYYSLFLCTNLLGAVVVFLMFPETKGKSLEEISAIFGDEVILPDLATMREKDMEVEVGEEEHVEHQEMEGEGRK
ncbi:related to transporter (major facilitator superfamily) [Phialocephala subalpina]|uniref:Related to transporter (Major facilitator superfamily) n=1 Tax=Phialocephala subalpina TaxID=576137 RepID=A0A1L7XFL4_9HELO|nr:related to transporter (major facilitator superfamily) [Phialocephala subalpina]